MRSFRTLAAKLDLANGELQRFFTNDDDAKEQGEGTKRKKNLFSSRDRANYAVRKNNLDKAIGEVEEWQRLSFDPLWFETMKAQKQQFDTMLKHSASGSSSAGEKMMRATLSVQDPLRDLGTSNVFLPAQKLESAKMTEIPYSSVKLVQVDHKWRLMDVVPNLSSETVRELAVRLKKADPATFGLLTCLGAVDHTPHDRYRIIFRMPDKMSAPVTLREKLITAKGAGTMHSLSDRFRIATQLARAVFHLHTFDMVHKSIQPENILLFKDAGSSLGSAFLLGFERVRRDVDDSRLSGDVDWAKNLYRHPERQGANIQERYIMQHDIYSLGVCLLELGLWSSPTASEALSRIGPSTGTAPEIVKSHLLDLAVDELPAKMGRRYASVFEACLTCLDIGNDSFDDVEDLRDEHVGVGVRFIEKVLMQLSEISI
ncbi:hypothetical protein DM02DRAFT_545786 [Periconia macrospinosa]|uniref:Protein kinase domain-containing protein n=1 Tax=Periconia macrospinosa TaxID=97972 RepID=A0A2V1D087_9PLEO|nr:hypothetical protein DM02DRAFT_545786 [Periconia macrospinosa]